MCVPDLNQVLTEGFHHGPLLWREPWTFEVVHVNGLDYFEHHVASAGEQALLEHRVKFASNTDVLVDFVHKALPRPETLAHVKSESGVAGVHLGVVLVLQRISRNQQLLVVDYLELVELPLLLSCDLLLASFSQRGWLRESTQVVDAVLDLGLHV